MNKNTFKRKVSQRLRQELENRNVARVDKIESEVDAVFGSAEEMTADTIKWLKEEGILS